MNRRVSCLLVVLLLLFTLSGCSALQAWEKIQNQEGIYREPDKGPTEPDTKQPSDEKEPPSGTPSNTQQPSFEPQLKKKEPSFRKLPEKEPEPELQDNSLTLLQDELNRSGKAAGFAFIGYMSSDSSEVALRDYIANSDNGRSYPFLITASLLMTEGDELYAVVPPNEQGTVTVYPSTMSETGEYMDNKSAPLFEGQPGEPAIVLCNLSDLYSNVLITVTDGGGAIEIRPGLSGEDGRLPKEPGMYDFSVYEKPLDEGEVEAAMLLLQETAEVQLAMQQGMSLMYTGDMELINGQTCLLFALGTDHEEQFVRERYYAVGDGSLYAFDSIYGTWSVLGMG